MPVEYDGAIGQADALLKLFALPMPELFVTLHRFGSSLGPGQQTESLEEAYNNLPPVNFSQEILTHSSDHLAILRVKGIYWNDWGNPDQVRLDIARFGAWPPSRDVIEWTRLPSVAC